MCSFSFLDATAIDTPIFDEAVRGNIFQFAPSFEIAQRYEKATAFRSYLENQWLLANISAQYFDFAALLKAQDESFVSVKKFIEKRATRQVHRGR